MAKKIEIATENNNQVINNVDELTAALQAEQVQNIVERENNERLRKQFSGPERWLIKRFYILLEKDTVNSKLLDEFVLMIEETRKELNARRLKNIEAEIARLTALKETLV